MRTNAKRIAEECESSWDTDRRAGERHTLVLRVAVVDDGKRATFCLLKNISADGVQVRAYATLKAGSLITLHVGEEKPIAGQIVWFRDRLAGIKFEQPLSPDALLRVEQKACERRRRASPRLYTRAVGKLRAFGRAYRVTLRDISASGVKLETSTSLPASGAAVLELPDLPPINAFIRWSDEREAGLSFASPLPIEIIADWLGNREEVAIG